MNRKLKAILVDDVENNLVNLEILLKRHCPDVEVVDKALDAFDANSKIEFHHPELVFLDIQMPKVNGLDLLTTLSKKNIHSKFILVTAYKEFSLEALKRGAFEYLLKPIDKEELITVVSRANKYFETIPATETEKAASLPEDLKLMVNHGHAQFILQVANIIKIESDNNSSIIFDIHGNQYLTGKTLKHNTEILPGNLFIRVHKTYLVNIKHVLNITRKDKSDILNLSNQQTAIIAKGKKHLLIELLKHA